MGYPDKEDGEFCSTTTDCVKARYINWSSDPSETLEQINTCEKCHVASFSGSIEGYFFGYDYGPGEPYNACDLVTAAEVLRDRGILPILPAYSAGSNCTGASYVKSGGNSLELNSGCALWGVEGSDCCDPFNGYIYPDPIATETTIGTCHVNACIPGTINMYQRAQACPPNTHLENGNCVPDEGWEWCDDSHTSACPHCYTLGCLEATDGSANPDCYDVGATFEICLQWIPYDPDCHPTSEMDYFDVPITYEGSLANSISGPDELRIDIQDNSTGCITLSVNSSIQEGGTLSIVPTNQVLCDPNQTAIVLELCTVNTTVTIPGVTNPNNEGNVLGIVNCSDSHSGNPGTGPNGEVYGPEDCCSYMPKDYLVWKEGIGLAETIPPYMKSFFINNE